MSMMSGPKGLWLITTLETLEDVRDIARYERLERERRKDYPRLINGLYAIAGHCSHCDARLSASNRPAEYRIRDDNGNVITSDWIA